MMVHARVRPICRRIRLAAREGTAVEARSGTILLLAALIPLCHPAFAQGPSPPNQVQRIRRQYLSYIPTDEGFLYLAALKDLATREIVGWSMAEHLKAGLCLDALVMALQRCRPPRGLLPHSDRGVPYAAGPYRAVLERHGIQQSMSRRGNCLDNAPMERFLAALKTERVHEARFRTRAEGRAGVFEYIEVFYNRQRLHSALGYRTPAEARASMEAITMREAA